MLRYELPRFAVLQYSKCRAQIILRCEVALLLTYHQFACRIVTAYVESPLVTQKSEVPS